MMLTMLCSFRLDLVLCYKLKLESMLLCWLLQMNLVVVVDVVVVGVGLQRKLPNKLLLKSKNAIKLMSANREKSEDKKKRVRVRYKIEQTNQRIRNGNYYGKKKKRKTSLDQNKR